MSHNTAGVWKYEDAREIAKQAYFALKPFTDIIDVAGSIRRKEPFVNDIEIICLPSLVPSTEVVTEKVAVEDLFGDSSKMVKVQKVADTLVRHPEFVKTAHQWECVRGDALIGRYTQRILPGNIKLDLFMPQAHDYYRMLAIRTGSVNFVKGYISKSWATRGWRGTDDGLRRVEQCLHKNGKWVCVVENPTLPAVWKSEQEFFEWIGYRYVNPENRSLG